MFVSTAQGWPARCSARTAPAAPGIGAPAASSTPSRSSTTPAGVMRSREGWPRRRSARAARGNSSEAADALAGVVGIAVVTIDEHGAQPARARRPRCRRRGCRPPSRRARRGAPPSASAAAKIVAQGLRRPCAREASAKSTAIPSCAANGSSSRSVLETSPTVQPDARRRSSSGVDVREELEVARVAPRLLGRDADLLGLGAAGAHAAHDLDREAAVLGAAVLERADRARRATRRAAPARSDPGRAGHRSGRRARRSRWRRTRGADGST